MRFLEESGYHTVEELPPVVDLDGVVLLGDDAAPARAPALLEELADRSRDLRSIDPRGEGDFPRVSVPFPAELESGCLPELSDPGAPEPELPAPAPLLLPPEAPPLPSFFFLDQIVPMMPQKCSQVTAN